MKTRPHLNPAFILYKYLSLSLLLFKTQRFILDKCLTPKPPLKEPTCPQWTSKPSHNSTSLLKKTLNNDPNFNLPHLLYTSCQTHFPEPQTTSSKRVPFFFHSFLYFIHFDYCRMGLTFKENNTIQAGIWPHNKKLITINTCFTWHLMLCFSFWLAADPQCMDTKMITIQKLPLKSEHHPVLVTSTKGQQDSSLLDNCRK